MTAFLETFVPSWKARKRWLASGWRKRDPCGLGTEVASGIWVEVNKSGRLRSDDDPDGLTLDVHLEDAPSAALD